MEFFSSSPIDDVILVKLNHFPSSKSDSILETGQIVDVVDLVHLWFLLLSVVNYILLKIQQEQWIVDHVIDWSNVRRKHTV